MRRRSSSDTITRSYDYRLPKEVQADCLRTLDLALKIENQLLKSLWAEGLLKELHASCDARYVWKWLEKRLERPETLPSRVWRGILEQVGRILRVQADRQNLFYFLKTITENEQEWSWQLCADNGRRFVKANYIYALKEAVERHKAKHDGSFPESYVDITRRPELKNGIITYAPDDGQAIKCGMEGHRLEVSLKLLGADGGWAWRETSFDLPSIVLQRLGEVESRLKSPDLRWKDGKAFLDLKVQTAAGVAGEDDREVNKLFVDWGTTRKLLAAIVVTPDGTQLGAPMFLKYDGVFSKLHRIRQHIDHLGKARARVARRKDGRRWDSGTNLINQSWAKYRELQKELSHLASNALVDIAAAYECDAIYVEDLSTLKSRSFGRRLNRVINNTVRSQIYSKVSYKAKLKGIGLHYVKAWWTSQTCPLTGARGRRLSAPDGVERAGGGWFTSDACSLDSDYVACKNMARRVLYDFSLAKAKALAYRERATLGKQFSRGVDELRNLGRALSGWNGGTRVVPDSAFYPLRT